MHPAFSRFTKLPRASVKPPHPCRPGRAPAGDGEDCCRAERADTGGNQKAGHGGLLFSCGSSSVKAVPRYLFLVRKAGDGPVVKMQDEAALAARVLVLRRGERFLDDLRAGGRDDAVCVIGPELLH